ncbi:hypothetical protein NUKP42_04000 [Klebsiella variicola]|jgi:hypothetical protein|nr:hypothetical protein NUKP42_04000 [Klebsiella variicola]
MSAEKAIRKQKICGQSLALSHASQRMVVFLTTLPTYFHAA